MFSSVGRWVSGVVCLCVVSGAVEAQTVVGRRGGGPPSDAPWLDQVRARPEEIGGYLALSSLYYEARRYDDAERFLKGALTLVRKKGAAAPVATPQARFVVSPARAGVDVTFPPKLREVPPEYPPAALDARLGGSVGLEIMIDERGRVSDARVVQSVAGLDDAALAAVRQWEFIPTVLDAKALVVSMPVMLTFIPDPVITAPHDARRQLPSALTFVRRFVDQGALKGAEILLESVILAVQKERDEPRVDLTRSITTGKTSADWPVRAGRDVALPPRLKDVRPVYSPEARGASGLVTFEFVIDAQGKVTSLRTMGSPPAALEKAARHAVQQWEFAPTLLAGQPVPVATGITFSFSSERVAVDEVVRVGGDIQGPRKIKHVNPVYPREAQARRQSGLVVLDAIIDPRGKVIDVRVVKGVNEGFDLAATAAVKQWEFTPTLVGGVPVAVVLTVTVTFSIR